MGCEKRRKTRQGSLQARPRWRDRALSRSRREDRRAALVVLSFRAQLFMCEEPALLSRQQQVPRIARDDNGCNYFFAASFAAWTALAAASFASSARLAVASFAVSIEIGAGPGGDFGGSAGVAGGGGGGNAGAVDC